MNSSSPLVPCENWDRRPGAHTAPCRFVGPYRTIYYGPPEVEEMLFGIIDVRRNETLMLKTSDALGTNRYALSAELLGLTTATVRRPR